MRWTWRWASWMVGAAWLPGLRGAATWTLVLRIGPGVLEMNMRVGTRSVLFGAHQFLLHPLFLAEAWWRLWGWKPVGWWLRGYPMMRFALYDPRLWVAFFVHDLGYLGAPNMDGEEGERHPFLGARLMSALFDRAERAKERTRAPEAAPYGYTFEDGTWLGRWGMFTLLHSRFLAKGYGLEYSPLCVADKQCIVITPAWLYLPMIRFTGEIREYMSQVTTKYKREGRSGLNPRVWHRDMVAYLIRWVAEHRDGRPDTMTTDGRKATDTGVYL